MLNTTYFNHNPANSAVAVKRSQKHCSGSARSSVTGMKGFSLVELLVALLVGTIIVTGAFSLFSTTRKTQQVNESQMDMVADARFAMEVMAYDLRQAGMWGATNKDGLIDCRWGDASCAVTGAETIPTILGSDCEDGWYYNITEPINGVDESAGNPYSASCIPGTEGHQADTDILEIRYADANLPLAGLTAGQAYIRSNFINGKIFIGATAPTLKSNDTGAADPITNNRILHAYAYYVSNHTDAVGDGIPSLRRVSLVNGPALQNQTLVSGVADMQLQFGEDVTGNDQVIDVYVDADNVTDWTKVYSVKIWLLMRSDAIQQGVDTTKSFILAGKDAVDYGGKDDFRFFLVSSVVNLRNVRQL